MTADNAARQQALDTSRSFIVQAPAGSGKTELLIQRHLKLLASVDTPDSIIAITFTRKAAGEMRARVGDALRNAAAGMAPEAEHQRVTFALARSVLEQDRRAGWNLLNNPSQMRIETIDALCATITRRMPWLSRFGAMPEISERAEDLHREAAQNTLGHVESNEALARILLHLDNDFNATQRLIMQMLEKRDQWLRHTGANPDFAEVRAELEQSLQRLILEQLRKLRAGFDPNVAAEIAVLRGLEQFPEARLEDLECWESIASLLLTGEGKWRRQVNKNMGFPAGHRLKNRCEQLLAQLQNSDTLLELLNDFRALPAPRFTESQWQALEAAVSVLTLAVAELQIVFRERGRVDFPELAIRASFALGQVDSPTDLALALGHRIQHILMDEFQDTSYTQFELLEKLTAGWEPGDGRTLFLVGDPMQSIYRFRQADVSLFLKARAEGIGSVVLDALTLSVNFRSRPEIVSWVNRTFEAILPAEEDIESGAVTYSPSSAGSIEGGAQVEVHAVLDAEDEADRVLELIQAGGASKTALLVRSRSHLAAIVTALNRRRVPFQAIEIDQLGERPVVEDLMALTLALLHPADRVSWLAILRAPWCGLTLHDLEALAASDHGAAIWDLLHSRVDELSEDGSRRIRRILPVLERAHAERGRRPLRDWIEGAWVSLGGAVCADDAALKDAEAYFELLEGLQEGADLSDFGWFREQVNLLFAQADSDAGDKLQLMTIHKAKGLEFDTVILPGLGSLPRKEDPRLLLWLEQRGELLLAPISESGHETDPIYKYLQTMEQRKVEHETGRLLYVAATRARERLHLLGAAKTKEDGSMAPATGSLLKLLWPMVSEAFATAASAASNAAATEPRKIRRLPADWRAPAPPPPLVWTRRRIDVMEPPEVRFEWAGDRARYAGTALHGFLERIAREGLDQWDESTLRGRRGMYRAVLANLGVPLDDLAESVARVESGLLRTLRDPRGRWILESHTEAGNEARIAGLIDGKLCEATIDRTFIDEQGVRWIIDYKTSEHQGADLETFLDNEKSRYQEQLVRYARLLAQRDNRPIWLGLYFPLLSGWREWAAPVVLRRQASLFEL